MSGRSKYLRQLRWWTSRRFLDYEDSTPPLSRLRQLRFASTEASRTYTPDNEKGQLDVRSGDDRKRFHYAFLRDACSCSQCVDPSTKQKSFQTSDIRANAIKARRITDLGEAGIQVEWQNDVPGFGPDHISTFSTSFFNENWTPYQRHDARYRTHHPILWDKAKMEKAVKWVPYDKYVSSDTVLSDALDHLAHYGLIFLYDVPSSEDSVVNIGTRIGPLRDTFYGRTWDVKSKPNPKNVAYTHQNLGLHMDLLYMQNPPGLQLLHCLKATCSGGNSLFSDSFRAVARLEEDDSPAHYDALLRFPVTYHYRNAGHHYRFTRPTVELETQLAGGVRAGVAAVNWSPPFQGPFEVDIGGDDGGEALCRYITSAKKFADLVEAEHALFELKLEEGQCVVFNNRRTLHARRAFDVGSGERWLKGAYVDTDVFQSRLRVLGEQGREI